MRHTYSKNSDSSKKSWLEVLEDYENKITHSNSCKFSQSPLFFSLEKIESNLKKIDKIAFTKRVHSITYPIGFLDRFEMIKNTLIIKYTGEENYYPIIKELLDLKLVHQKAIIISPNHLSKMKRNKENILVKQVASCFNPTLFIKLPLFHLNDYLQFARNEPSALLLLPFKDLEHYIEALRKFDRHLPIIPAVFQPNV